MERALREFARDDVRIGRDAVPTMTISGAGKFSVLMEARTRSEAQTLGTAATLGMIVLLLFAYRRVGGLVLSALPLASAGLAGLASVSALFGEVHGITLAFGFTLIGVAQDYPLHLLSHRRGDRTPVDVARALWPALATGVASTCIAYFTFLFSGVVGLAQLACFTVAGLAVAGLTTRYALPPLMAEGDAAGPDYGDSALLERLWNRIAGLPRLRWAAAGIALACLLVVMLAPSATWENDLGKLTPVPADLLRQDQALREELGTPDVRYLLAVHAADVQRALARLEALQPSLQQLVDRGAIAGYDDAARYVPTIATQRKRQARLPDASKLRADLRSAQQGTPFRPEAFQPFIADVEAARALPPLTVDRLRGSPLESSLDMLLNEHEDGVTALVTFSGVRDVAALGRFASGAGAGITLLDMKAAAETLVAGQRVHMLWSLTAAAVLLIGVVAFALRSPGRILRVLAPMALTTLIILAVLRGNGTALTLFHLIALILAAGLGLDYALFFEHSAHDRTEQRRTLHAVLVCSLSTLMVFALLATSSLPVLRAIGVTVSLGVISNFLLALLLTRPGPAGGAGSRRVAAWRGTR
jgi:predicted exporter